MTGPVAGEADPGQVSTGGEGQASTGPEGEGFTGSGEEGSTGSGEEGSTGGEGEAPAYGRFRVVVVAGVSVDLPNQHPTVVLRESETPRRQLSFAIGLPDAVAMTHALRRIPTPRPLTAELMSDVLQAFDIDVVAVRVVGRRGLVYFAELDLRGRSGRSVRSCRPSDGLTVALLQPVPVPVLVDERLFESEEDLWPPGPEPPTA